MFIKAYYRKAKCYTNMGGINNIQNAIFEYKKILDIDPNHIEVKNKIRHFPNFLL